MENLIVLLRKILSKIFEEYYLNRNDKIYCIDNLYKKFYVGRYNFIKKKYGLVKNEKLIFQFNRYNKKAYIIKLLKGNFRVILDENETYDKVADDFLKIDNIIVTGFEYKKETESYDTLSSTVADELTTSGIKVTSNDFSACHRNNKNIKTVMSKGKQVKIPPSVTVRFYNTNKKDHVLNKYKNHTNGKAKPVRVVQSLNHHYQTLKSNISNLCRENDTKISWIHWRSASSGLCIKFDNQIILSKIHSMADFNKQFNSMNSKS